MSLFKAFAAAYFAAVLSASAAAPAPATEGAAPGEWTMDFDAAKALAAQSGLPILLNFTGSDWCGWCIRMDRQVFSKAEWQDYARDNLVLVWIDSPRDKSLVPERYVERNRRLMDQYDVAGFPAYLLLDPADHSVLGQTGASADATPRSFIDALETLRLASDKSIAAIREAMDDESRDALDAARQALEQARQKLEDWIETGPDRTEENVALFLGMRDDVSAREAAVLQLLRHAKETPQ